MTERETRIQTVCLTILASLALGWVLYWSQPVMIPFVVAIVVVLALGTVIDFLAARWHFPRWLATACAIVLGVGLLTLLGFLMSISVASLVQNASLYQRQIRVLVDNAIESLPLAYFGLDSEAVLNQIPLNAVGGLLVGTGNALIEILSQGFLVIVFVVFLMIGGPGHGVASGGVWEKISSRVKRYIVTKVVISGSTGIAVGLILGLLDIPLAIVFGLMTFLLNFIPSLGSAVAVLLPLPIVLVDPSVTTLQGILAIGLPAVIQLTFGNFVEPKVLGESLELHPAVILIALVLWGMLWGVVGMFLAAPMTATLKLILERMEHTRPIADLLAGRVDALYQD